MGQAGRSTKAGRVHELPLADPVLAIIESLPRIENSGGFVFPARSGGGHAVGLAPAKIRLDRLSGVSGWRWHDLRRSAASGMARLGAAPHVVGAILDHSPASLIGVTAVYQRHGSSPSSAPRSSAGPSTCWPGRGADGEGGH